MSGQQSTSAARQIRVVEQIVSIKRPDRAPSLAMALLKGRHGSSDRSGDRAWRTADLVIADGSKQSSLRERLDQNWAIGSGSLHLLVSSVDRPGYPYSTRRVR